MALEKTTGIVLRVVAFSETSCIVTMFTREFGKITTMAKGARRPKSPFEAALDVLALCRIVFLDKSSGAMGLLTEAKLDRRFRSSSSDLKRLYAGYYVIELLNLLTDEGDPHPELFDFAVEAIELIDSEPTTQPDYQPRPLGHIVLEFELKALGLLGHLPMLTKCVSCGKEKTSLTRVSFGLDAGGILCQTCRRGQANIVSLSPAGLQILLELVGGQIGSKEMNSDNWNGTDTSLQKMTYRRSLFDSQETSTTVKEPKQEYKTEELENEDSVQAAGTVVYHSKNLGEVRQLTHRYITHLLGFPPKLHKYLKNI